MMPRANAPGALSLRRGTAQDLPFIAEFTQNTFSWGDYVPNAWDGWVNSGRGDLFVAEADERVVGTVHVRYLDEGEAWLEGMRVRPEFRRQGVATALVERAHRAAQDRACAVIRLETGSWNTNAQKTFTPFGYRPQVEYANFAAQALTGEGRLRPARVGDADALWGSWRRSGLRRTARGIVPAKYGWRWWTWSEARLQQAIVSESVFVTQEHESVNGWLVTRSDNGLDIIMLVAPAAQVPGLLLEARFLAARLGYTNVNWLAPGRPAYRQTARLAGWELDEDGLVIFECPLTGTR